MAKLRVHELAKELGITSKDLLAYLKEKGEFVKAASSTIEAPIVRQVREDLGNKAEASPVKDKEKTSTPKPASSPKTSVPSPKPTPASTVTEAKSKPAETKPGIPTPGPTPARPAPKPGMPGPRRPAPKPPKPRSPEPPKATAPKPASPAPRPSAPRPGPRPGGPRPGNNPYASTQGMPRPGGGAGPRPPRGRGGQGQGSSGGRGSRPNPGMMPGSASFTRDSAPARGGGQGQRGGNGGGRGRGGVGSGNRSGGAPGVQQMPGAFAGPPRGGRGGTRGSAPGAFGRGGGPRGGKGRKSKRAKRQEFEEQSAPAIGGVSIPRGNGQEVRIRQGASLADFADKINVNPAALVTVLFHLGEMATATQSLDQGTFEALGAELGYQISVVSPEDEDRELLESFDIDLDAEERSDADSLVPRPPVVTVMGHVDHGKTKLLDAIRSTDVVESEHGGITQHIGAYQVKVDHEGTPRAVTFIDTPGHEAFTAMRARGTKVTDIAILVVAADDGVMPQTVEAINHAQAADVPIVVAVNKVDKEEANPDKIRGQLTEYGLVPEEYGGDVMFVDVSAKNRQGMPELLEAVLLTADAALDLTANPNTEARGVAIEANLDRGRGAVATMLVERGTLHVGDAVVVGSAHGRVRAMFDENSRNVEAATPSRPVQVLGLTSVPRAGDSFLVASDDRTARQIADKRAAAERQAQLAARRGTTLEDFNRMLEEGKVDTLNLIIKGDVSGAVEALEDSLLKIDVGEDVQLRVIHRGVGAVTQNDVNLATVDNAVIIAFNVRPAERVQELANSEGVEIKYYTVIYRALEDIEQAMKGMLKPIYEDIDQGSAEIRQVFRSGKFGNIAGSIVRKGTIKRGAKARLVRDGVVLADNLTIESLRREKDDVTEVREGFECGITLGFKDIREGDVIETWETVEKARD